MKSVGIYWFSLYWGLFLKFHKVGLIPTIMIIFIIYTQNPGTNPSIIILGLRPVLPGCEARGRNVELQLRLNCFEAIKLALATQEVLKRDLHMFAIQILIKVEQVSLK